MSSLVVNLDAYIIPDDHKIYKLFPGKTYRFHNMVKDAAVAFLDIRGLEQLPENPEQWDDKEVLKIIADDRWNRELERISRGAKAQGGPGVNRTDKRNLTFLKGLLLDAKKGDLIVMPADGYTRDVMIGELVDEPAKTVRVDAADGEATFTYVGRRVRWLAARQKRFFSQAVIDLLHAQTAFFSFPRSHHEEIYRITYENFVYGDVFVSTFETTKQHFTSDDNFSVSLWFKSMSSLRHVVETDGEKRLAKKSFYDLALLPTPDTQQDELSININSPGHFLLRSAGQFALVVMSLFILAMASPDAAFGGDVVVQAKVVGNANPECLVELSHKTRVYLETLGLERWETACNVAVKAREEATLETAGRLLSQRSVPTSVTR